MQLVNTKEPSETRSPNEAASHGTTELDYAEIVTRQARRKIAHGSAVTQAFKLNQANLFSSVCAEVKARRGMAEKTLPVEVANRISEEIALLISNSINAITADNIVSMSKSFKYSARNRRVVEAVTVKGENTLALKEQILAINILARKVQKRLDGLMTSVNTDVDREAKCKAQLLDYQISVDVIQAELNRQEAVTASK